MFSANKEFDLNETILAVKVYPENQKKTACVEYSTIYDPPQDLQIPNSPNKSSSPNTSGNESSQSMSESTISSSSNSLVNSRLSSPMEDTNEIPPDFSSSFRDIDSKSSSATITPIGKCFPK